MIFIFQYLAVLVPLIVLDALWLFIIARGFYAEHLGFLVQKTPYLAPAFAFYPLYALAILFLVVLPALSRASWVEVLWRGALLGLAAYAAYDLTNHTTIAGWPLLVTVVDMLWGTAVTALAAVIAFWML